MLLLRSGGDGPIATPPGEPQSPAPFARFTWSPANVPLEQTELFSLFPSTVEGQSRALLRRARLCLTLAAFPRRLLPAVISGSYT